VALEKANAEARLEAVEAVEVVEAERENRFVDGYQLNGTTITGCRGNVSRIIMERNNLRVLFIAKDIAQFSALVAGL
jgi:hypothetical protein